MEILLFTGGVYVKIKDILNFLDNQEIEYDFHGNKETEINSFSSLKNYKSGSFTWLKNESMLSHLSFPLTDITLVFAQDGILSDKRAENTLILKQSKFAFFSTIDHFFGTSKAHNPVGANTYISPDVKIGENVIIGFNCTIDGDIIIGDNTIIGNNVVLINKISIGERCEIQSGCVLGHDGFGWTENDKVKTMLKHYGGITIENDVYIGPCTVIDRGMIDDTTIRQGAKIDAQCFIAHNVIVGKNVVMIAGSILYGSSTVGNNGYIASATVRNQCSIGEDSVVGIGAVVTKNVVNGVTVVGNPAKPLTPK